MKRTQRLVQLVVLASLILGLSASSLAQEQRIAREDVPAAVLAAFTEAYPKAMIKGCTKETDKGQSVYEIESFEGETRRDIIYSDDGKLILVEETLGVSEMPPAVMAALDKKYPGATILRAEKITKGTVVSYEFQIEHNSTTIEVVFDSMGNELKAILLASVDQSSSSSDPKVGDPQGSKAPPGTDPKHEPAVQAGSNGAGGAISSDPKVGDPQGSKPPPGMEPKQETAVQAAANGGGAATTSVKPTASFPPSYESNVITFTPGFRLQVRYIHDTQSGKDEIFVARVRLKAKGVLFHTVRYYAEYKFDTLGRSGRDPVNGFENAWLEYSILPNFAIRGGLYDVPFSRNALTSDSKLLFVDRSLIKDQLTSFGFADNTTGLLGHGRPFKGHVEYSVGIFNNEKFRRIHATGVNKSDHLMPAGRFVYHFLDPAPRGGYGDYQSSYVGTGKRLSIGANSAYLRKARDTVNEFNLLGWGSDVFFSTGPFSAEAEYDQLRKKLIGNPDIQMDGWYAQAGYLVKGRVEFAARHQQLDPNVSVSNNQLRWTSVGSNIYFRKHNVKLQLDYTFRRGPGQTVKTNVLQMQMQVDY